MALWIVLPAAALAQTSCGGRVVRATDSACPAAPDAWTDSGPMLDEASTDAGPGYVAPTFELATGIETLGLGRGVTIADLDGDGVLDILSATSEVATVSLSTMTAHRGLGGGAFEEVTATWGLVTNVDTWGLLPIDVDQDGDLDLFTTRSSWWGLAPNTLLRNDGSGLFVSNPLPVPPTCGTGASMGAVTADFDADGDLDVAVANGSPSTNGGCMELLLGTAPGLEPFPGVGQGTDDGFGIMAADLNDDLLVDIVVISGAEGAVVYRNLGSPPFFDFDLPEATTMLPTRAAFALTGVLLDYDQDADLDVFVCGWDDPRSTDQTKYQHLYRNDGDMSFVDVGDAVGVAHPKGCMGVGSADLDLNGYPDLYLGTGGAGFDMAAPNVLLMNRGDGTFEDMTEPARVAFTGRTHGIGFADLNADARPDLVVNSGGALAGQEELLRALLNRGPTFSGLPVVVTGTALDPRAIGARVEVHTDVGTRYVWLTGGEGFAATTVDRLLVGLGNAGRVDDVVVTFPDGSESHSGPVAPPWPVVELAHP